MEMEAKMGNDINNTLSEKYRPRFGEIAVDMGFITEKQLNEALAEQAEDKFSKKPHRLIGSILFEHGWITNKQIDTVLDWFENRPSYSELVNTHDYGTKILLMNRLHNR